MAVVVLVSSEPHRDEWRLSLEERGHVAIIVSTATAAVDKLREGGVDVLLVDYDVSGGIGPLVTGLQKLPDAPPFILVSGAVDAPVVSARLGAAAFVPKPCPIDELMHVVARVAPIPVVRQTLDESPTRPVQVAGRRTNNVKP